MPEHLDLFVDRMPSPIGDLVIAADKQGRLRAVGWDRAGFDMRRWLRLPSGMDVRVTATSNPAGMTKALQAYFAGDLAAIDDLPTAFAGTEFQRIVWTALREIPCGETISYGTLARRIGRPAAVRAVGLANGSNPISVVVPCHRVIGADGSLTGYGGGLENKKWLLAHEKRMAVDTDPQLTLLA